MSLFLMLYQGLDWVLYQDTTNTVEILMKWTFQVTQIL